MYIKRTLEEAINSAPKNRAVVLFGARQVGKTTLMHQLFDKQSTKWFTGDDDKDVLTLTQLGSNSEIREFFSGVDVVVVDEAQRVPSIGLLLKRLVDARTETKIAATGSSSLELAGGVMESAAGRLWPFTMYSLSVEELAQNSSWAGVVQNLPERLVLGSYPEVVLNPEQGPRILNIHCESLLFKDILAFAEIRKNDRFLRLVKCIAQNIGSPVSSESLARESGLTSPTVESYINILEQCFIIKQVFSYSNNLANELKKSRKIYFCDLGIRNAVLGDFTPFSIRSDKERGALWENFIFMERMKIHENHQDGTRMFFWRDAQKHEIDIIEVDANHQLTAIECKLSDAKFKFPNAFCSKYPSAKYSVATRDNFFKMFAGV